MSEHPKVSIIVPVYNGSDTITDCVSSLEKLDYQKDKLQIIIVNDGSTDDTAKLLEEKKLPNEFCVIDLEKNSGRAFARNHGLKKSKGEIIIFLDADMIIEASFVNEHISSLSNDEVKAVSGLLTACPNQPQTPLQYYLYEYRKRGAKQYGENRPIPFNYLITGNMSIKREVFENCGYFDEYYKGYGGEDTDYAIRIWEKYPEGLRFSARAISAHCQHDELDDLEKKIFKYGRGNYLLLIQKFPDHQKALSADWIRSLKGYAVINIFIYRFIKLLYKLQPHALFVRYFIAYNLIVGARKPLLK